MKQNIHSDSIIHTWVEQGSKVLDLGCGKGELLFDLKKNKQVTAHGIEIDETNIRTCIRKGLSVIHANLNDGLQDYKNHAFDYVIMNRTLQIMEDPCFILNEMLRVGRYAIINYPNFGYLKNRLQLFFGGQMPRNKSFPYEWYNTPNIHFCTCKDFFALCEQENIEIEKQYFSRNGVRTPSILHNLTANEIYCMIKRKNKKNA